jgi:mRNA-degrading endonuclease RelE of RelBE toxin-antitoxin system
MKWGLVITRPAQRVMRRMPAPDRETFDKVFQEMQHDPFAGDVKYLKGLNGVLRRRVGIWRIVFSVESEARLVIINLVKRRGSHTY